MSVGVIKIAKDLKYCELLQLYGKLLTLRQLDIMSCYYFEDLSLSEIGINLNLERGTVKTVIKRAETALDDYESKLNLLEKTVKIEKLSKDIKEKPENIYKIIDIICN